MKKSLMILGFIAVVAVAAIFVFTQTATTPAPTSSTSDTTDDSSALQPTQAPKDTTGDVTIAITSDGFVPSKVTAKVGDTILVRNDSNHSVQFSSDPHPVHTKNSELNQSTIKAGASQTFKVTRVGTWGFHDHLNSNLTGTITVE